ncbi:MAG: MATE family efflux transporter [Lachnospiraceae bacterium]|nr:MATE family efflux transporter [Lachnospiraceae bacterium]
MRHIAIHNNSKSIDMLNGPLLTKLVFFAMPIALTSVLQQLFNSADIVVCGRFVGSVALAAVGANAQIINLFINSFLGLSVGANVMIANYIGAGKTHKIYNVVHTAMTFAIIFGLLIAVLGLFFSRSLLVFLGTPEEILEPSTLYLKIVFIGMPFAVIYNFGAAILRSIGDTKRPLILLTITGVLNVVLNIFFVVICKMGVEGVAIATSISTAISSISVVVLLVKEKSLVKYDFGKFLIVKDSLFKIMRIGIPSAIQGIVFSISNLCVQSAINSLGTKTIAASTAAFNLECFPYFMISAFSAACLTFMSQNYGALKFDRCRLVLRECLALSLFFSGLVIALMVIYARVLLGLYTNDQEVIEIAMSRMYIVCLPNLISSFYEILSAGLRVLKYPMLSAIIIVVGTVVFRFIWILTVFPYHRSFETILYAYPISWIIINVLMVIAYVRVSNKMLKA